MIARARELCFLTVFAIVGCGGSVDQDSSSGKGGQAGGAGAGGSGAVSGSGGSAALAGVGASGGSGALGGTVGSGGTGAGGGSGGTAPADCKALADAISKKVNPATGACTAVVRVGFVSNTITGYKIVCGDYAKIDEGTAYQKAKTDTGIGNSCFGTSSITGPTPPDAFVFYQAASAAQCACCGDGWVTAVNSRAGVSVLGATIMLGGNGGIVYPASWDSPSDLGVDSQCGLSGIVPEAKGFDLTAIDSPTGVPPAVDPQKAQAVMGVVWNTALPLGLEQKGYVFGADMLLYSPIAGVHETAEWIVLLSSGWLE